MNDVEDPNIMVDGVPGDFMQNVFVGRCYSPEDDCSNHGGQFTDINFWDIPLTKQEMLDWTGCM